MALALFSHPTKSQLSTPPHFSIFTDQTTALEVKIILWYVLPISVTVFLFSVMGYSMYRYIHVGKEKHPANLVSKGITVVKALTHLQEDRKGLSRTDTIPFMGRVSFKLELMS